MIGVLLTVIAILLVICIAFCFADNRNCGPDSLFFVSRKTAKSRPDQGQDQKI